MLRKHLLFSALVSLACLLVAADFAHAQRGRGLGGRGFGIGIGRGYYGGGGYGGGYYPGYGYGGYGLGGYGLGGYGLGGYGLGGYGLGGYGYGGNYNRGYGYSSGYYSPNYSYAPNYNYVPNYTDVQPAQPMDYANIRVLVPDPNARVWFDGTATQQTGTDRLFSTPTMSPGANGTYRIRASWNQQGREVVQERSVTVTTGQTIIVDFNQTSS